ncbi:MAG: hypothetical protein EZS28_030845 [Streblomastix strix]|uniref:Uncharacterized protein n=1 Tax=Streblomastix strix TaxID=222440 RepID=A0A5J4UTC8_9EUKA|nr:MAG: hypothetical protein EZS28_030845 [Streblomastix strix]
MMSQIKKMTRKMNFRTVEYDERGVTTSNYEDQCGEQKSWENEVKSSSARGHEVAREESSSVKSNSTEQTKIKYVILEKPKRSVNRKDNFSAQAAELMNTMMQDQSEGNIETRLAKQQEEYKIQKQEERIEQEQKDKEQVNEILEALEQIAENTSKKYKLKTQMKELKMQ